MVDICKHLVAGLDLREPETYADCFDILAEAGVMDTDAAARFKAMVRFRNMLIHVYDTIDNAVTYGIYTKRTGDFLFFIDRMRRFLTKKQAG